jgi:tRNA (guanine37-N1)-methyltransferase
VNVDFMSTPATTSTAMECSWKSQFEVSLELVALRIAARQCNTFTKRLGDYVFTRPKVRPIIADPEAAEGSGATRLLLLSEAVRGLELAELPVEVREFALAEGAQPVRYTLRLGYEILTAEQVLRLLLPAGIEVPSAFEQVGHIAHVNLRAEHLPYKRLIGQVLLEKNSPRLRSVVNKVESLSRDGTAADQRTASDEKAWRFRVFPMEVLAGESNLLTSVRENGARFELDYREVYWNSRLETEHKRIVEQLGPSAVVADAFAGIGPFAVPAALRGASVYANDLNPASHQFLVRNVEINKVGARVRTYNLDGRAFVLALLAPAPTGEAEGEVTAATATAAAAAASAPLSFGCFSHVLMNLPASALTFLDVFVGAFDRTRWTAPLPRVHCYCFSKADDPRADVIATAERLMGCTLPDATAHVVRDVSPHKLMMCLEFTVPEAGWAGSAEAAAAQRAQRAEPSASVAVAAAEPDSIGSRGQKKRRVDSVDQGVDADRWDGH